MDSFTSKYKAFAASHKAAVRIARERDQLPIWQAYQSLRIAIHAVQLAAQEVADIDNLPEDMAHLPESVDCLRHIATIVRGEWNTAVPIPWIEVMDEETSTDDTDDDLADEPHVISGGTDR